MTPHPENYEIEDGTEVCRLVSEPMRAGEDE